jgi:hypothetical protein
MLYIQDPDSTDGAGIGINQLGASAVTFRGFAFNPDATSAGIDCAEPAVLSSIEAVVFRTLNAWQGRLVASGHDTGTGCGRAAPREEYVLEHWSISEGAIALRFRPAHVQSSFSSAVFTGTLSSTGMVITGQLSLQGRWPGNQLTAPLTMDALNR